MAQTARINPVSGSGGPPVDRIRRSWLRKFSWTRAAGKLRTPQLGALHAVLGYWSTAEPEPATVTLPTGAGKTDLMIALAVAADIERLLVVVPSDGLRDQISRKFEKLGILRSEGIVGSSAIDPRVGRVLHRFDNVDAARDFAGETNVIVATPSALAASSAEIQQAVFDRCTHLFVDEAHHVGAPTWRRISDAFGDKPKVQFTATPYRQDGRRLGGRPVYTFSLKAAQSINLYAPIDYISIRGAVDVDKAVAEAAIERLQSDLARGLDHLVMARASSIAAAEALHQLYQSLASDLKPQVIHSRMGQQRKREALARLDSRESRVIVCVDMLGEGYDLPNLKIAALHDVHRSLGITLQFIGRFARTSESVGTATVVAPRPEGQLDENLRALYQEDADWNDLIVDLSVGRTLVENDINKFEAGFSGQTAQLSVRNALPRMSTVVYRTTCSDWNLGALEQMFPNERLLSGRMQRNDEWRVVWFILESRTPVSWTDLQSVEDLNHVFYAMYWDEARGLLYINCSGLDGVYEREAKALCGESSKLIRGSEVYRSMALLDRRTPTTVGLLDNRNRWRRFTSHVGADVSEGFPDVEAQTKMQTNIFATGFDNGVRATVGASIKGRLWSYAAVPSLKYWIDWCDQMGGLLTDETINVDTVIASFIRPQILSSWPALVSLGVELSSDVEFGSSDGPTLDLGDAEEPLAFADLRVVTFDPGPPTVEVATPSWTAQFRIDVNQDGLTVEPIGAEPIVHRSRGSIPLSQLLNRRGFRILLENDTIIQQPGILLRPNRDVEPYSSNQLVSLDTTGMNIRKESQGQDRDATSIQAHVIRDALLEDWDIVIDDDGSGEIADVVCLRLSERELNVSLIHCKYSSEDLPGARVADLYELCGQAQKSARRRSEIGRMCERLIARERGRMRRGRRSGFERGDLDGLYEVLDRSEKVGVTLSIKIVQPGLSRARVSTEILHLIACTEVYVREIGAAALTVVCSV